MEASLWNRFKNNIHLRRATVLVMIILALYYVRAMMNTILLTFIFTYLILHLVRFVQGKFKHVSDKLIVALTYLLIVVLLYFALRYYVPVLVKQVTKMTKSVINYYQTNDVGWLMTQLHKHVSEKTISSQVKSSLTALTAALKGFGSVTMSFVMALVLSFFYTIELKEMQTFSQSFLKSDLFGWFFEDIAYFGRKFTNTFGVVLEAQFLIAICNTTLTIVCLAIMKMPQIFCPGPHGLHLQPGPGCRGDHFLDPSVSGGLYGRRDPGCDLHFDHDRCPAHPGNLYLESEIHVQQDGIADLLHLRGPALWRALLRHLGLDRQCPDLYFLFGYPGDQKHQQQAGEAAGGQEADRAQAAGKIA